VKSGKLCAEQDQIGVRSKIAHLRYAGRSLELCGNIKPRGMTVENRTRLTALLAVINSKGMCFMFEKIESFVYKNFHSLYHRNYRYFFFGQVISLIGTWIQVMAQAWLVYTITNSPLKLGIVSAMQFLPTMIFSLFAGVIVDKLSKKKILIFTQIMAMLQAFVLFALVYMGVVVYWHVVLLAFILGCTNSLDMPARQAYVIELVGRKDLVNAVGLNSAIFNTARIVGPAIAGILMTGIGIEWCFFINGISFISVIASLFMIQTTHVIENKKLKASSILSEIVDGLNYIYKNPVLFKTSLIILFVTIVSFNYNVLIPVFAKTVLGLKEKGFGILLSSLGVGSLIGAVSVSILGGSNPKPRTLMFSSFFLGLCFVVLGFTRNIYSSSLFIALCGIFNLWFFTVANSVLQLNSSDEYRGRVMGVYTVVFAGASPIGNFISGYIAEEAGAPITFTAIGIIMSISMFVLFTSIKLSNKYLQRI